MNAYRRRVSTEEARQGYLLVEKARLRFFPTPDEEFLLDGGPARIESYPCTCRGPERPHEHWFVRLQGLAAGDTVEIERTSRGYVRR